MKVDVAWLNGIKQTRQMVQRLGPMIVTIPDLFDRQIVLHQYQVLHDRFRGEVDAGVNPSRTSSELWCLWDLTEELIHGTGE